MNEITFNELETALDLGIISEDEFQEMGDFWIGLMDGSELINLE